MRRIHSLGGLAAFIAPLFAFAASPYAAVDPSTLDGKVLFGYQGWFGCPGAWGGNWSHWGNPPNGVSVEMYPDLSDFAKSDLCPVAGYGPGGSTAYFYSVRNIKVTDMHFKWMQDYGLDGVLIQRFVSDIPGLKSQGDKVLQNILASSAKYGRVIAIEYDVTGAGFTSWAANLEKDWQYLNDTYHIASLPNYLRHKGRPLVSVWGMGLNESRNPPNTPAEAQALLDWFHKGAAAPYQASVMGGVPAGFRTHSRDSRTDPGWLNVWKSMDAVQPWNVGRYNSLATVKSDFVPRTAEDQKWLAAAGVTYMPVIFPGYSFYNANHQKRQNEIPRLGGNFLWQQAAGAKAAGASCVKIAMFDEVNEGTAMYKVASKRSEAPPSGYWLTLDADGLSLPNDWYLRLAGEITQIVHGEKAASEIIPIKPTDPWTLGVRGGGTESEDPAIRWRRGPEGIRFAVGAKASHLVLHDARGSLVRRLPVAAGGAVWNLRDGAGSRVAPGVYAVHPEFSPLGTAKTQAGLVAVGSGD
jgi:hypothetical protein